MKWERREGKKKRVPHISPFFNVVFDLFSSKRREGREKRNDALDMKKAKVAALLSM